MKNFLGIWLAVGLVAGQNGGSAQATAEEIEAATVGKRKVEPAEAVPRHGTFFSWQRPHVAPSPFDAFPELTVYDLGGGRFLLDDRDLDYSLIWELAGLMAES